MLFSVAAEPEYVYFEEPKIETNSKNLKTYGKLAAPMVPHSVSYPRGRHIEAKQEKLKTNKQGNVERIVRKYTNGTVNEADFRRELKKQGVTFDNQLNKLVSKHEAGDFVTHKQLGKEALRRVIDPQKYNHADKVNLQNPSYVASDKRGKDPVSMTSEIKQTAHEDTYVPKANMRFLHENTMNREIFGKKVYIGKKGQSTGEVQNQQQSSDPSITKWEKSKPSYQIEEDYRPSKKIFQGQRDHHMGFNGLGGASEVYQKPNLVHRSSYSQHQATRSNFNIFGI
jgi:hypothetical protein